MIWVKFPSIDAFNEWHNGIKNILGLPKPSTDNEGNIDLSAIQTTDYIKPIIVEVNDIRVLIDEIYANDLEESVSPFQNRYGNS